jgi:hypothetical protein
MGAALYGVALVVHGRLVCLAQLVLGAAIRLEEGIRMEEDGGELTAREEVIPTGVGGGRRA